MTVRCAHCGGRLHRFQGETYCPDCTRYTTTPWRVLIRTACTTWKTAFEGPEEEARAHYLKLVARLPAGGHVVLLDRAGRPVYSRRATTRAIARAV
jgi:hypothetical protein